MPFLTIPEEEAAIQAVDRILNSGITALLGYAVVFSGLVLLMLTVLLLSKLLVKKPKKAVAAAPVSAPPVEPSPIAPGTAGDVKLHNVDSKTAAMLMAIVADKMQKPINELRFISIKEVE